MNRSAAAFLTAFLLLLFTHVEMLRAGETKDDAHYRAAMLRVRIAAEKEDWSRVQNEIQSIAGAYGMDDALLHTLASAYVAQGRFQRGALLYRALLIRYPDTLSYRTDFAFVLSDAKQYEGVVLLLDGLLDPETSHPAHLWLLANALDRTGRASEADSLMSQAAESRPDDSEVLLSAAERLLWQGRAGRARPLFLKAADLAPDNARAVKGAALTHEDISSREYSRGLERAMELDTADFEIPYLLGNYYAASDKERMRGYFEEAVRRLDASGDNSAYTISCRARMAFLAGDTETADALYSRAIAQDPRSLHLVCDYADILLQRKRPGDVLELLRPWNVPPQEPGAAQAQGRNGLSYATPLWLRPELSPGASAGAAAAGPGMDAWLRATSLRAEARMAQGNYEAAAMEYKKIMARAPADEGRDIYAAQIFYQAGRWDEAYSLVNRVLRDRSCRMAAAQAFELRQELREKYADVLGVEFRSVDPKGELTSTYRSYARLNAGRDVHITVDTMRNVFRDPETTLGAGYDASDFDSGVKVSYHPEHGEEYWVEFRGYGQGSGSRLAQALGVQRTLPDNITWTFEATNNANWIEPIDAAAANSTYDDVRGTVAFPLGRKWFASVSGGVRQYYIYNGRTRLGTERWGAVYTSRLIADDYDKPCRAHRYTALNFSYHAARVSENTIVPSRIDLIDATGVFTVGLSSRFVFGNRTSLIVSGFLSHDDKRNLSISRLELYGYELYAFSELSQNNTLYLSYQSYSESPSTALGGKYQRSVLGLEHYLDP